MVKEAAGKIRAKLVELWTRATDFSDKLNVYLNGEDNMYPSEIERVINNSPTASRAVNMMAKYIGGRLVGEDAVINKKKNLKKSDIVRGISNDVARQYGCFIHVSYGINDEGNLVPINPRILDYTKCRISKKDDDENEGKIYVKDYEKKKGFANKTKKEEEKWYYPFNSSKNVVISQIKADAKLSKIESTEMEKILPHYRGQVYYLNLTPSYVYAISLFDSVYNDCDTEYRMSLYTNSSTRNGFMGKLAVLVQGLDPESEKQIEDDVHKWLGAEESSNVYFLSVDETTELDKVLLIKQVKTQYDEKQFTETRKNCRTNILGAANNIPEALIYESGGLFAQSGEAYKQMKVFYSEQTEFERKKVEETMNKLGFECKLEPLVKQEEAEPEKPITK